MRRDEALQPRVPVSSALLSAAKTLTKGWVVFVSWTRLQTGRRPASAPKQEDATPDTQHYSVK